MEYEKKTIQLTIRFTESQYKKIKEESERQPARQKTDIMHNTKRAATHQTAAIQRGCRHHQKQGENRNE